MWSLRLEQVSGGAGRQGAGYVGIGVEHREDQDLRYGSAPLIGRGGGDDPPCRRHPVRAVAELEVSRTRFTSWLVLEGKNAGKGRAEGKPWVSGPALRRRR
ncbi:hypothetical protein GCM10014715_79990 [Streptomyces spiralis]|uniref:Uncharacterized protein n=1 Tax=Streptomyces spiralis TaxID=66376 RepID=A0A919AKH2_9ACTN|nr:hypothetical protein GCM10014715_79990 [Streptomyces spiralis]